MYTSKLFIMILSPIFSFPSHLPHRAPPSHPTTSIPRNRGKRENNAFTMVGWCLVSTVMVRGMAVTYGCNPIEVLSRGKYGYSESIYWYCI